MELFGPHTVNSIADLLGINTTTTNTDQGGEKDERQTAEDYEVDKYLIRRGDEKDVFKENPGKSDDKSCLTTRSSDYTYDDYRNEFEREATAEEVYGDDVRSPVEYEITDCETFQAGRLPDNKFLLVNISLLQTALSFNKLEILRCCNYPDVTIPTGGNWPGLAFINICWSEQ